MAKKGEIPEFIDSYVSEVDLSSSQYCVVVQGTNRDQAKLPSAAGEGKILGVVYGKTQTGTAKGVSVVRRGPTKVKLGGQVAAGDELEIAAAAGTVRKYTGAAKNGRLGTAEEDGVSGDIISAFIDPIDFKQIET
jgi:hypothetical protein